MKTPQTSRITPSVTWLAAVLVAVVYLASELNVVSDVSQFLPESGAEDERLTLLLDELKFGQTSRVLFVRLRAHDARTTGDLSMALKQRMLDSDLFEVVANGQFDVELSAVSTLFEYRYLLSAAASAPSFSVQGLRAALERRLQELRAGMGMVVKQTLAADPTSSFIAYLRAAAEPWGAPAMQHGVWFTRDGQSALLIASIKQSGFDLDRQQAALEAIEHGLTEAAQGREVTWEIAGPATFAVATRAEIQRTLGVLSLVGGGLLIVILLLAYRSVVVLVLAGIPLISAVTVAMAVTNATFGAIHGITLAFGVTLLGVCLDYPVHLFSHVADNQPPRQALRSIWPTLRLGALTTSLGYLVLLWSGFVGLAQLALFAVVGLAVALVVTRWVIPAWVTTVPGPGKLTTKLRGFIEADWRSRYGAVLVAGIGSVAVGVLIWRGEGMWAPDVSALSPIPEQARLLDRQLRNEIGAPDVNHVFILTNQDPERLLQETEQLAGALQPLLSQGIAQHLYTVTELLPSQARQRERQGQLPQRHELQAALEDAVAGLPFKANLFEVFVEDVERSRRLTPLSVMAMQDTPLARQVASEFFYRDGQWVSVLRLAGVADDAALESWLADRPEVAQAYVNLRQAMSQLLDQYRQRTLVQMMWGGLFMVVVVLLFTRSPAMTLRVLVPPALAIAASLGTQALAGAQLNLFHLLSVLLVVGIGVDYSLFFNRRGNDERDRRQSLHGVAVSAASTLAAFGVLMFSGIPVMVAIGQTVALGVVASFILALLLAKTQTSAYSS